MNLCFLLWISVFPLELWLCLYGIPLGWLPLSSICYKRSREPMLLGMWQEPRSYRRGVSELIAENQSYELGSRWDYRNRMQWWRRVDSISQRKNKPQPVLNGSFLRGLNEFFAKLCQDDSYTEPSFQEIDREKYLSPRLNETEVMLALSKIKKTASGSDTIPYWIWRDNVLLLDPVVTFIWNLSLCSYTWPEAWKESNISPLPKVGCTFATPGRSWY